METETQVHTQVWDIDPAHSEVAFTVKHMLISTVRGHFDKYTTKVVADPETPENSTVEAQIETTSVNTGNTDRDNHLRSADFFDAERYPLITFRSKTVKRLAEDHWKMTGDLTIRGITKEITLDIEGFHETIKDPWGNLRVGGTATGTLNRFDYGLQWNAAIEAGGLVVGETIKIRLDVELMRKA